MVSGDRSTIPRFFQSNGLMHVPNLLASKASADYLIGRLLVLLVSVIDFFLRTNETKRTVSPKSLKSGINKPHTGHACALWRVYGRELSGFRLDVCLSELDPGCYYYASGMALPRSLLHHHHLEPRPRLQNPSPLLHPQTPTPPRFSTFPELDSLGVYTTKSN